MNRQITPYLPKQEEFLRNVLTLIRDELCLFRMMMKYHSYTSMVLSSVSNDDEMVKIHERIKSEPNFSMICSDEEYLVYSFGNDVGTVIFSYVIDKQQLTVNINL